MKLRLSFAMLAAALLCWGIAQSAQAQTYAGCYESGEISCAPGRAPSCEPSCAPACGAYGGVSCYGDDGCYDACNVGCYGGYCCGGLFAGIGCIISEAVQIVLTPVHWVASLFCCGTYADCGCAPPVQECYSDPCDMCGNYVGDCGGCGNPYYGYQGYYSANGYYSSNQQAAASEYQYAETAPRRASKANPSLTSGPVAEKNDYVKFDKVETIGQKKAARRQAPQVQNGESFMLNEQVMIGAPAPRMMNPTPAQASRNARRVAAASARQARQAR